MNTTIPVHVRERLKRALARGRIGHAYMFAGKKGSGKKEAALFFARSLLCKEGTAGTPCCHCTDCRRIEHGNHPDVHWVKPEGMSIKIEQVRQLQKEFSYRKLESGHKVYVVEAVESMTTQAANSLLKFLEEPHAGTVALLLTENKQQLLSTILSRCQDIYFPPPSPAQIAEVLQGSFGATLARLAAHLTADVDDGQALCQAGWFAELKEIVIKLTKEVQSHSPAFILIQDEWMKVAAEKEQTDIGLDLLLFWYRDLLSIKHCLSDRLVYIEETGLLQSQADQMSEAKITEGMSLILEAKRKLHAHVQPQLLLEQLMLRLQSAF